MSPCTHIHRWFGPIRRFKRVADGREWLYYRVVPGHTVDSVKISYQHKDLISVDGDVTIRDKSQQCIIYRNTFHELIQLPKAHGQVHVDVQNGILLISLCE